jgi:hypothetical protein
VDWVVINMKNMIKKTAVFTGVLFVILLLLDLWFKISIDITNTLYLPFLFLVLITFIISTLILFVKLDIKLEKFVYLKVLNYFILFIGFLTFLYWGFIKPDFWGLIFTAYSIGLLIINTMIISVVYIIKKIDKSFVIKQWLLIIFMVLFYLFTHRILKIFGIIIFKN